MRDIAHLSESERRSFAEASAWQLRLTKEPSLEVSPEFQAWLSEPMNQSAFDGVVLAWQSAEEFAVEPRILDMRQEALRRARGAGTQRWQSHKALRRVAAAVVIGVLAAGAGFYYASLPDTYSTAVGERRLITLADGSHVSLDSDSQIEVQYAQHSRQLVLDRGRARFDVVHDVSRPFSVRAGTETVVAVGTTFDVEKINGEVVVTLIHGRIVVKEDAASQPVAAEKRRKPVSLESGQELVAAADKPAAIAPANLEVANSWESGRLVFSGDSLAEAVARVNRYTDHPIEIDPSISSLRIIGAFNAGDVSGFVNAVTSYFPIQATTTANNSILLQPKS